MLDIMNGDRAISYKLELSSTRALWMIALAACGPIVFMLRMRVVGPQESYVTIGVLPGYALGLAWWLVLRTAADYRVKLRLGTAAIATSFFVSFYFLSHTGAVIPIDAGVSASVGLVQGLSTFILTTAVQDEPSVGSSWRHFGYRVAPVTPLVLLAFLPAPSLGLIGSALLILGLVSFATAISPHRRTSVT